MPLTKVQLRDLFADGKLKAWKSCAKYLPDEVPGEFWPEQGKVFAALKGVDPKSVEWVILGQDPYPADYANGIPFTVDRGNRVPPSLRNFIEVLGVPNDGDTTLSAWRTTHGVLLLNAALTVPKPVGKKSVSGKHQRMWAPFVTQIVQTVITKRCGDVRLLALGANARERIKDALFGYHQGIARAEAVRHPTARPPKEGVFEGLPFRSLKETPLGKDLIALSNP